jgi:diamine N-acetyltransferase
MLIVQIDYTIRPEHVESFKKIVHTNALASTKEVGVIRFDVFQNVGDPTRFSLLEIYADEAAQQTHFESDHFKQYKHALTETEMATSRTVRQWENIFPQSGMFPYPNRPWSVGDIKQLPKDATISLREITKDNIRAVLNLHVDASQRSFVADNARSLAQAGLEPKAWTRAIYADDTPVGFVMNFEDQEKPTYYLWRYMVDYRYQGMGFGKRALELIIDRVKTLPNAAAYYLSYVPAPHGPRDFYTKLGFVETGEVHGDEIEMVLKFANS